jgi:hypothetical protein
MNITDIERTRNGDTVSVLGAIGDTMLAPGQAIQVQENKEYANEKKKSGLVVILEVIYYYYVPSIVLKK